MGKPDSKLKNWVEIPIEKLVKADWNYKEEDQFMQERLESNLKLNDQIENIIVRELDTGFYEVVNGNHRYEAMKSLEFTTVVAYNLGKISDAKAQRIAIATNETKFKADQGKFINLINSLIDEYSIEELAKDMPYSPEEMENYKNLVNFDWSNPVGVGSDIENDPTSQKISFNLPKDIAEGFLEQIARINRLLYPDNPTKKAEPIMAIQVITQIVIETPDEHIK